jgi:hypothetical protein
MNTTGQHKPACLRHENAGVLGLLLGLDMDGDHQVAHLRLQRVLDPVTDLMRGTTRWNSRNVSRPA